MSMLEYLKISDIILSLFLHKNWTGLILLAPTVYHIDVLHDEFL